MPSDPIKAFPFLFYLQITSGIETRKERSSQTCKGRKRERERTTHRHSGPTPDAVARSRRRVLSSRCRFLSLSRSPFPFWIGSDRRNIALIAILPSRQSCRLRSQHHAVRSRLRLRCAISPLVKSNRLSLFLLLSIWSDLMIFFSGFCLCFSIEEWMILYICLAAEKMWENVSHK